MSAKYNGFGNLFLNFQRSKKLAVEIARQNIKKRNSKVKDYELRESMSANANGDMIFTVEMWRKVDVEHMKISASVTHEALNKTQASDELKDLLS